MDASPLCIPLERGLGVGAALEKGFLLFLFPGAAGGQDKTGKEGTLSNRRKRFSDESRDTAVYDHGLTFYRKLNNAVRARLSLTLHFTSRWLHSSYSMHNIQGNCNWTCSLKFPARATRYPSNQTSEVIFFRNSDLVESGRPTKWPLKKIYFVPAEIFVHSH